MKKVFCILPTYNPDVNTLTNCVKSLKNQFSVEVQVALSSSIGVIDAFTFKPIFQNETIKTDSGIYTFAKHVDEVFHNVLFKEQKWDYVAIVDQSSLHAPDRFFSQIAEMERDKADISISSKRYLKYRAGSFVGVSHGVVNTDLDMLAVMTMKLERPYPKTPIDSGVLCSMNCLNELVKIDTSLPLLFQLKLILDLQRKGAKVRLHRREYVTVIDNENMFYGNFTEQEILTVYAHDIGILQQEKYNIA